MDEKLNEEQTLDASVEAQHNIIGIIKNTEGKAGFERTSHPDAQGFENLGLGLFIHCGIASVHGGIDISWSMIQNTNWDVEYTGLNKVTPTEYFKLADKFNPENYDPDKWIKAAALAGFSYAVLTTKHHDGYALWPSEYSNFCTRTHMGGRDLLAPYVEACRKNGLKVGFYYSPPDWYYNKDYMSFEHDSYMQAIGDNKKQDFHGYDVNHNQSIIRPKPDGFQKSYLEYIKNQIKELLTGYGKIDIIWFDGGPEAISIAEIRELQPGIVINTRMHGYGDFETPECYLPKEKPKDWWEACLIWNFHEWGYQEPHGYKPVGWMLNLLARCRTWKGNLLLNCALKSDGTMPDLYYEKMEELKAWMEYGKESVFNVDAGPYPEQSNVPVTVKENTWYLHLLPKEDDVKGKSWYVHLLLQDKTAKAYELGKKSAILTGVEKPKSVKLLCTGEKISYEYCDGRLELNLDESICTLLDDVVVVSW